MMFLPIIANQKMSNKAGQTRQPLFRVTLLTLIICTVVLSGCGKLNGHNSDNAHDDTKQDQFDVTCATGQTQTVISSEPQRIDNLHPGNQQIDLCPPEVWGAAKNVVKVQHVYIASQPDAETFEIAREHGVSLVINLRGPSESDWDERNAAEQAEMGYYNIPVAGDGDSFDPDAINQISALVQQHKDQKILLHCSSGNRASAWLAIHFAQDHNMDTTSAISLAKQAGLTSEKIATRVERYLQQ